MTRTSILVVQQQPELRRALQVGLRAGSYDVVAAGTGREAVALAARRPPDAVIIDLSLPDVNGVEVITELRTRYRAPIIVLSGRAGAGDKIGALDAGADDYVTKPFVMGELLARLRAKLRRHQGAVPGEPALAVIGHWRVDLAAYRITPEDAWPGSGDPGQAPRLTALEWAILEPLLQRPGQLVGPAELAASMWGGGSRRRDNCVRYHLVQLRRKLEDNPARPRHLLTEHGLGYRYLP